MIGAILTILGALIPFAIWLYKDHHKKNADPKEQHRDRFETIDQDIASRDSSAATAHATADLDELDRLRSVQAQGDRDQR